MNCVQWFSSKEILTNHQNVCLEIEMLKKNSIEQFSNYQNQMPSSFTTYADFEYNLKKFKKLIAIMLLLTKVKIILLVVMITKSWVSW